MVQLCNIVELNAITDKKIKKKTGGGGEWQHTNANVQPSLQGLIRSSHVAKH